MNKKKVVYHTFLHLFLIISFATANPLLIGAFLLWTVVNFFKDYKSFVESINKNKNIIIIYLICVSVSLFNFYRNDLITFHVLLVVIYLFIAVKMSSDKLLYYHSLKYSFIILQVFVILFALNFGFGLFPVKVPFDFLIEGSSANGITSYAIFLQINYSILKYHLERKIAFKTVILTFVIALMGYGRGSILSAFLILFVSVFLNLLTKEKMQLAFYLIIILFLLVFTINNYYDSIFYFIESKTKLTAGLVDKARSQIIVVYMSLMDGLGLLLGVDYENSVIVTEFRGNPHNSFIRAHHIFGLPYLLFVIFYPFKVLFKNKNKATVFFNISLMLVLCFRAFSEPIIFPTLLDIYLLTTIIIIDNKTKH